MSRSSTASISIGIGTRSTADGERPVTFDRFDRAGETAHHVLCLGDTAVGKTVGTKLNLARRLREDPAAIGVAIDFFGEYQTLVDEFDGDTISVDSGEGIPDGLGTAKFTSIAVQGALITANGYLRLYLAVCRRLAHLTDKRVILVVEDAFLLASAELDDEKPREWFEKSVCGQIGENLSIQFITQDPRPLLRTAIGRAIVENCPIKLFYRSSGLHTNEAEAFGLDPRQVDTVRQLRSGGLDMGTEALLVEIDQDQDRDQDQGQNVESTALTIKARSDERALLEQPETEAV